MSPTNPSSDQNSTSPKPVSESTRDAYHDDDDFNGDVSDAAPSFYWSPLMSRAHIHQESEIIPTEDQKQQMASAINTDYESSAAEDHDESFTSSKYETAEFALLSYSRTNKLEKLHAILQAKLKNEISLDLNVKGQQKQNFSWSALHLACYFGHIQVVELLLSKKAFRDEIDINIKNNSSDTPLHKATLTNRTQIVLLLLSNGADVFIKNCDGLSAKQLTNDRHILEMLQAAEKADKNRIVIEMFKAVDNGDLKKLQGYFEQYSSLVEASDDEATPDSQPCGSDIGNYDTKVGNHEPISQITDERGNNLLHIAAMRGFQAICIYLLEQGFDAYTKNHLSQAPIDLASYQLRQLFSTVKPANSQLKKLNSQRVTRFEGPMLKKVRILGWKQIYVVLENGCILLFNNRRDSMNKSRRGYKYLESATCEPDPENVGAFTIDFSDKSKATFLVSSDHLNSYSSFKFSNLDQADRAVTSGNQIELIRQKWIDLIRDHIRYSTNFIKSGLKINNYVDDKQTYNNAGDLTSLNHLLPVDTIKSFIQEARAHYSILERHADSLCSLVQSINATNRDEGTQNVDSSPPTVSSSQASTTTGNRLFNFIRPSRQNMGNSVNIDDSVSVKSQQSFSTGGQDRKRSDNSTSEFMQDNWHCILFHLRLLVESTENTKVSMNQALTLMEHQEQLRQDRIQDQDERCRVLEDSLHALARDHHQLEKSLSVSQIYQSAASRSLSHSMSTDLNEYFEAFEDFDDAASRTLTPTSMPTDECLEQRIQEVMIEEDLMNRSNMNASANRSSSHLMQYGDAVSRDELTDNEQDDDDIHSHCSALTVETDTDISVLTMETSKQLGMSSVPGFLVNAEECGNKFRTKLPASSSRGPVSIWSFLKNFIGKDLSKITMPVLWNMPLSMTQLITEPVIQNSHYLKMADESDDPVERMEYILAFIISGISPNCHRIIKPFNPLLYETYEYIHELDDGTTVKSLSQQVSHHPPITAICAESNHFVVNGSVNPKIKFWGKSVEVEPDGQNQIHLKSHNETYVFKAVSCCIHNVIVGKLWFEHKGPLEIRCVESGIQAHLTFKQTGWFGASSDLHSFDGFIMSTGGDSVSEKKKLKFVYGKWSDYIKSVNYSDYENYLINHKIFKIPDKPGDSQPYNGLLPKQGDFSIDGSQSSVNNNSIASQASKTREAEENSCKSSQMISTKSGDKRGALNKNNSSQSLDIPNSRTLWKLESKYLEEYYNFTQFTMRLNELNDELAKTLPRTDSRFRQDVRKLEEGDLDGAASEKQRLEDKQREARARDSRFKDPSPDMLWFDLTNVAPTKEKFWIYKGGYWESKCNPDRFPDLF